jgi:hypothetical protein
MNELAIQRLVDGRLSLEQIQKVLQEADATPELWKQIATAFLEEQLWQQSLSKEPVAGAQPRVTQPDKSSSLSSHRWLPLAIAASLLLALPLVYSWGRFERPLDDQPTTHSVTPTELARRDSSQAGNEQKVRPADFQTPYSVGIRNNNRYESVPVLPQSVAQELGYQPSESRIPPEVQAKLRREGYQLDSKIHFLRGSTGDGREIIVPVQKVQMQPYGQ